MFPTGLGRVWKIGWFVGSEDGELEDEMISLYENDFLRWHGAGCAGLGGEKMPC